MTIYLQCVQYFLSLKQIGINKLTLADIRRQLKQQHFNYTETGEDSFLAFFVSPYSYPKAALDFFDTAKDVVDFLKPYKTIKHRQRDLLKIFTGIKHTFTGLLLIPTTVLLHIGEILFTDVPTLFSAGIMQFARNLKASASLMAKDIIGAAAQTLRGVAEICFGPFTMIRATLYGNILKQKFQDRKSVKLLVEEANTLITRNNSGSMAQMTPMLDELYRKAKSNVEKKQECYPNKVNIPLTGYRKKASEYECEQPINGKFFVNQRIRENGKMTDEDIQEITMHLAWFKAPSV